VCVGVQRWVCGGSGGAGWCAARVLALERVRGSGLPVAAWRAGGGGGCRGVVRSGGELEEGCGVRWRPGAAAEVVGQGGSAPVTGGSPSAGWLRPPLPAAGAGSSGVGLRTQASVGRMAYGGSVMRGLVCVFV